VMRMLEEEDYTALVSEKGAYLLNGLRELKKRHPVIGDVDGLGLALRVEVCKPDGFTPDKALTDKLVEEGMACTLDAHGKRCGLVLDVGGYSKNVLTLAPALTISREEMDLALDLLDQLFRRCA
jgi:4-aminobutyrate aminotransferase / (S)-3-amino-2-methylpropionate transaminase / 5-aminovalerate transaminase